MCRIKLAWAIEEEEDEEEEEKEEAMRAFPRNGSRP